jgi:hypothetical protein
MDSDENENKDENKNDSINLDDNDDVTNKHQEIINQEVIDENNKILAKELEKILIGERLDKNSLPNFLLKHGNYDILRNIFGILEKKHETNPHLDTGVVRDLLMGKIGPEHNKQKALYELPTIELIKVIEIICEIFNLNVIEEIMAGQGLLSAMIEQIIKPKNPELKIITTDGENWLETVGLPSYTNIEQKLLIQYLLEGRTQNTDNKLWIICWPSFKSANTDLQKFIQIIKPKYLMIIGELNMYSDLVATLETNNYASCELYPKQISYRDYFLNADKYGEMFLYPKNASHSEVLICINKNNSTPDEIETFETTIPYLVENAPIKDCFREKLNITDNICCLDMVTWNILPKWYTNLSDQNKKDMIIKFNKVQKKKLLPIPTFITTYDEFVVWSTLKIAKRFPKLIQTRDRFVTYLKLHVLIKSNQLDQLKSSYVLPDWITTTLDAEKYIWLDYSTLSSDKSWKQSRDSFINRFQI